MRLPAPEPALIIRYSYLLWLREHREGREEGTKDRPCAVVLVARDRDAATRVLVVPVTHSPPDHPEAAIELPAAIKRHLGLDTERSRVVLSESNVFVWPGPDLRRMGDRDDGSIAYGFLPPRFFAELRRRFLALETAAPSRRIARTE